MQDACASETCWRMLMGEGIATIRSNHKWHLDRRPIYAQVVICLMRRIAWSAA
jgi:hypothetical protein